MSPHKTLLASSCHYELLSLLIKQLGHPQLVWVVAAGFALCLRVVMQRSIFLLVEPFKELSGLEAGEGREL